MASPEQSAETAAAPLGTIIHRKAQAGRADHQARAVSLAKALRLTLAKVADQTLEMQMGVMGVRIERQLGEKLAEPLKRDGLLMLLDGPERARAAAILDHDVVASLIQQQTMGKVQQDISDGPRQLTATDAAICAPFLDELLKQAAPLPDDPLDKHLIAGFRFGAWVEDPRLLGMALEAHEYELIHLDIDIAGGVRQGHILLCMPKAERLEVAEPALMEQDGVTPVVVAPPVRMSETVLNLNAEVRVGLTQVKMSLEALGNLAKGSTIKLENPRFDAVRVQTITGQTVARGVLGQLDGQRTVKLQAMPGQKAGQFSAASGAGSTLALLENMQSDDYAGGADVEEPGFAALPDLPDLPDMPELTDMPDSSDLPDMSDLPTLGAQEGFEDLPDLPDLSDLPSFD